MGLCVQRTFQKVLQFITSLIAKSDFSDNSALVLSVKCTNSWRRHNSEIEPIIRALLSVMPQHFQFSVSLVVDQEQHVDVGDIVSKLEDKYCVVRQCNSSMVQFCLKTKDWWWAEAIHGKWLASCPLCTAMYPLN